MVITPEVKWVLIRHKEDILLLASVALFLGGLYLAVSSYSQYGESVLEHQLVREDVAWLDQARPYLLKQAKSIEIVEKGESILSTLNREAKHNEIFVERAEFQSDALIVSLQEAPFVNTVLLLNTLERAHGVKYEFVAIKSLGDGKSRTRFAIAQ